MRIADNSALPGTQQSSEWFQARIGKLTASNMKDAIDFLKGGGESQKRKDLKVAILAERMTDIIREVYVNPAMQWGTEHEGEAKLAYTERTGSKIMPATFVEHPSIENFGASPDGFIDNGGLIEIKCPTSTTHLKWIMAGVVPEEHRAQMLAQLACTRRTWCEFVSYDPRMPAKSQLFIRRYTPTAAEIEAIERAAITFLDEVDNMFDQICNEAMP